MYNVLLVDDEVFFRQGLIELIDWSSCGFAVKGEADNGEDALDMILTQKPDVVITDIRMPVVDGLELIRRAVQEEQLSTKFIIVSGYDEFKYAQQAVKYGVCDFLLKPIDELALQETLKEIQQKLQKEETLFMQSSRLKMSELVTALIKGSFSEEQLEEWLKWMGISPDVSLYYLFVEANDVHPENRGETADIQLHLQLQSILSDMLPAAPDLYIHAHRSKLGLAIAAEHLPDGCRMEEFAAALGARLREETGLQVYIYVGKETSVLTGLKEAYQSAADMLNYKFTQEERMLFMYARLQHLPLNYVILDSSFCSRLIECMEENNEIAVRNGVDEIFQEFQKQRYVPEAVKASIHRCVSDILSKLEHVDIGKQQLHSLERVVSWQDTNITLPALKQLFYAFVTECTELLVEQQKDMLKGSIQKIKKYIDANYMKNISLKSIAAQFYMNSIYVGQLFKKSYGVYFNDYVLQLRVSEAKRLIRQTDMRIYEIAERVGFNHVEYFVTQFEKSEKMTPTEYRNMLR